jgi:hypothetical protein
MSHVRKKDSHKMEMATANSREPEIICKKNVFIPKNSQLGRLTPK